MIEFRRRTIVTNQSGVTADFVRKRLTNGESFEIIDRDINVWRDDPTISGAITSGDLEVSNGIETFGPAEGEFWFYGLPHSPIGSLTVGDTEVLPNDTTGSITLSGVGLVTVDPLSSGTIHISTPDAVSIFELVVVSGTLQTALVTATGIILDLVTDISSPASTVQGGFVALDEALSSTTSTSFQEKLSLTGDLSAVFSGTSSQPFRLQWYYEWGYSSASSEIETQITVDDVDIVGTIQWSPSSTNATDFAASSGYIDMTLSSGTHFFDIDFRSTANGKTSRIQRTRMALSPLTLGLNEDAPPAHGV
jgi:hypothetical protein